MTALGDLRGILAVVPDWLCPIVALAELDEYAQVGACWGGGGGAMRLKGGYNRGHWRLHPGGGASGRFPGVCGRLVPNTHMLTQSLTR